jgi:hypothetical protein
MRSAGDWVLSGVDADLEAVAALANAPSLAAFRPSLSRGRSILVDSVMDRDQLGLFPNMTEAPEFGASVVRAR